MPAKLALIIIIALSLSSCSWISGMLIPKGTPTVGIDTIGQKNQTAELAGVKKEIAGDDLSTTHTNNYAPTWYNSLYLYGFLALLFLIIMWGFYKARNTSTQHDKDMIDQLLKMVLDKK